MTTATMHAPLPTPLEGRRLHDRARAALQPLCADLSQLAPAAVLQLALPSLPAGDGGEEALEEALALAARALTPKHPDYGRLAARLLLRRVHREVAAAVGLERPSEPRLDAEALGDAFVRAVRLGVEAARLDPRLLGYDLERMAASLRPERDGVLRLLGLQTLADRYLLRIGQRLVETPQIFWMRVAMGVALAEPPGQREEVAAAFYELLSSLRFVPSTPTLFNAGTVRPQLSSCFVTTVPDELEGIFEALKRNALLSKYAGGLGNDWSRVRALGACIGGTHGRSQGVLPFLKLVNDTAVAVNQGGRRKGAVCAYLEAWHLDFEDFLELRKNTGDERRRTHDMNTAAWIPDLFMERVARRAYWTLFSPDEVPELHELYGRAFREAYEAAERRAERGEIRLFRRVEAEALWRRMLTMLYETGHPWITFKDPCNVRSPQRHAGVVHSSNLCTEITLNTSDEEVAVCNLGSVNLARHVREGGVDEALLRRTVRAAMRFLDDVIDVNLYTVDAARAANQRHRPVGLGVMGFQDVLHALRIPYASERAVQLADSLAESVSWFAIEASADLARERGSYASFEGSDWSQGILPPDTLQRLAEERGGFLEVDRSARRDWDALRERVREGMRHSLTQAIAPTATIGHIAGVTPSIEPTFRLLHVRSNLSGEFVVLEERLVEALQREGLWDEPMREALQREEGRIGRIDRVPEPLRALFATAFEIDPRWLVEAAARRQKWIDQAQSLNLYVAEPDGRLLDRLYKLAWVRGLKTTYYLRTTGASQAETVTLSGAPAPEADSLEPTTLAPATCRLDDPDCEACQ